jgi:hypothetical protein
MEYALRIETRKLKATDTQGARIEVRHVNPFDKRDTRLVIGYPYHTSDPHTYALDEFLSVHFPELALDAMPQQVKDLPTGYVWEVTTN